MRGELDLPRDDILDDIALDVRQAEIRFCQSTSTDYLTSLLKKRNQSTVYATTLIDSGERLLPRDDIFNDIALNVRQAEISPGVAICQTGMVQAKQLQNCRMEIMDVYRVIDSLKA